MSDAVLASAAGVRRMPWPGLLALFTAAFTAVMTELLPAGLLPLMAGELDVPEGRVGFLVTAYAVASFLSAIPVTALLRGVARRRVLIGVLAGFAVLNGVTALSSSYALTFGVRVLAGVMGGVMWAMLVGYAARMVPPERRGRAIAIVSAGVTVALCAGIPAGAALASASGWRAVFVGLAVVAVVLIGWVRWQVPDFPGEAAGERVPLRRVVVLPGVRILLGMTALVLVGHQAMYTYLAPFVGGARTGAALLVFGLGTVAGIWAVGVVIDRRPRAALVVVLAVVAGALAVLGVLGGAADVSMVAVGLWGAAFGGVPTLLQTALVNVAGPGNADVATSLQTTVYNAGIAAGSLAGGLVLESAGAGALPWAALPLVAVALAVAASPRSRAWTGDRPVRAPRTTGETAGRR
ncbi:Predicted arabinose efflux permease, MFS family [Nonomuraea solani]|uniref:Predicted arabinose efflux permease, MFS family n=1 Tax=Nonomuraea solani TaxID=1144553 RepID=A0A1H6ES96_9ACTN|nr:MFS transporter [Nonomuraea solani]SEG99825.1 Predicted arabinose efflux permease, MFS family [Nonomuraea solani]